MTKSQADRVAAYVNLQKREAMYYAKAILAAGYRVGVHDGEEMTVRSSDNLREISDALFTTDDDRLIIRAQDGERIGWFWLVYGNEPGVLVSDYSDNPVTRAIYEAVAPRRERMEAYRDPR